MNPLDSALLADENISPDVVAERRRDRVLVRVRREEPR